MTAQLPRDRLGRPAGLDAVRRAAPRPAPRRTRRGPDHAETPAAILAAVAGGLATNRADLARRLGLAPSTVTRTVGELLEGGVLHEAGGGPATGGRRARVLKPSPGAGHLLVAAIGHRVSRAGVLDLTGSLLGAVDVQVDPHGSPEAVLRVVLDAAAEVAARSGGSPLRGVGVAVPGPVDDAAGAVDSAAALPEWHGVPLRDRLRAERRAPAVVENDANALALGEHARRAAAGAPVANLLVVKVDAALGCALVIDGRVLRGATPVSGDVAHVRVGAAGEAPCACGKRGCLETVAGHQGIARALAERGVSVEDPADTARLVAAGDRDATAVLAHAGTVLGAALAPVVAFTSPHVLALGGALGACAVLQDAVRAELHERCHPLALAGLRVEPAAGGADAELVGVGQRALRLALVPA